MKTNFRQFCTVVFVALFGTGTQLWADTDLPDPSQIPALCYQYYSGKVAVISRARDDGHYYFGFETNARAYLVDSAHSNFQKLIENARLAKNEEKEAYITFDLCTDKIVDISLVADPSHNYIHK